jgi:3-methyladenine DNA glycosylase/8-oxoguanine DNA glycosylase
MEITLQPASPFSYHSVVDSHGWAQLAPFDRYQDGRLGYVTELAGGQVVSLAFSAAPGGLRVSATDELAPEQQAQVQEMAAWMFALEVDLAEFYELARQEPKLAHVLPQARGRVLRSASLFEDVVKTILTTNVQWGGTKRMVAGLVEAFGAAHPGDPQPRAFPTAERLAGLDEMRIAEHVRLGYRTPYVLELAREVASGRRDLEALKHSDLPTAELRRELLSIKGVGGYAAANLLMLLGRYDAIPIDTYAHKMVSQEFYGGEPVTPAQINAAFESWGAYRGLAFWFWDWEN